MTFVKVCGMTRLEDARAALDAGATALGFVFWPNSPRHIAPADAGAIVRQLPYGTQAVGVFVNEAPAVIDDTVRKAGLTAIQLHGDETPDILPALHRPAIKAVTLDDADAAVSAWPESVLLLLDAHDPVRRGGTGRTLDWTAAARIAERRRVVLAGGLTAENIQDALAAVRPFGVDVSSGVEDAPGIKNRETMIRFLDNVKAADHVR